MSALPSSLLRVRPSATGLPFQPHQQTRPLRYRQPLQHHLKSRFKHHAAKRLVFHASAASSDADVVIVGGGLAGLSCGLHLQKAGVSFRLLETDSTVGGRVQTDVLDGFLLDRGFQIFLTSYPEAQAVLDYAALDLKPFYAGALVWWNGKFHRVADPVRHFGDGLTSLANPVGSIVDKVNVGVFRLKSLMGSLDELLSRPETTTLQRLQAEGFSQDIIDRFFRPFLGGIFFDRDLQVSSRLFEFVMRMLATGANCLPTGGIGAVSQQLASCLPADAIQTGKRVQTVRAANEQGTASVTLVDGQVMNGCKGVVVAAEGPAAAELLGEQIGISPSKHEPGVGTCCLYFRAPKLPTTENVLFLNGETNGIVNNACFPSNVSPSYAPSGQALVSVSTIGTLDEMSDGEVERQVRQEMGAWFGTGLVQQWSMLRIYRIPYAQPCQSPPTNLQRPVRLGPGLYVCGDHRDTATFDGALKSGRRAAEALLADTSR